MDTNETKHDPALVAVKEETSNTADVKLNCTDTLFTDIDGQIYSQPEDVEPKYETCDIGELFSSGALGEHLSIDSLSMERKINHPDSTNLLPGVRKAEELTQTMGCGLNVHADNRPQDELHNVPLDDPSQQNASIMIKPEELPQDLPNIGNNLQQLGFLVTLGEDTPGCVDPASTLQEPDDTKDNLLFEGQMLLEVKDEGKKCFKCRARSIIYIIAKKTNVHVLYLMKIHRFQ
jgi:hypothetical protein